jgi:hypothetical protein
MFVYIQSEPELFSVGFYDPSGQWHADSDHSSRVEASARVSYLNGGGASANQIAMQRIAEHVTVRRCPRELAVE